MSDETKVALTDDEKVQKLFDSNLIEGIPPTPVDTGDDEKKEDPPPAEEEKKEEAPPADEKKEETAEEEKKEEQEKPSAEDEKKAEEEKSEESEKESSLDTEQKDGTSSQDDPPKSEKTADEIVREQTSGKYNSMQELVDAANSEPDLKEVLSERILKLHEMDKAGADIEQVLRYQGLGLDKYDPNNPEQAETLIKLKMSLEDPRLKDYELDHKFKIQYGVGEDVEEDSVEAKIARNDIVRAGEDAKTWLSQKQKESELPKPKTDAPLTEEQKAQQQKELDDARTAWSNQVDESLKGLDKLSFKVGEKGKEIDFDFSVTDTKPLKEGMVDINQFYKRYVNGDGSLKLQEMAEDFAFLSNKEAIVRSAHNQGVQLGRKETIDDVEHIDNTKSPAAGESKTELTPAQQVAKQAREKGERI